VKLGDVRLIKLADVREKAKKLLAERQLNGHDTAPSLKFDAALERFLKGYAEKKPSGHGL